MVTLAGTQSNEKDLIEALLLLEQNALEAYDSTIEHLESTDFIAQIREFRQDHYGHIAKLTQLARDCAADVPGPGAKSWLTKGKVVIANMIGNDSAILHAMKTNEDDTVSAYENALKQTYLSPKLRACCTKALADERRHRDWMNMAAERKSRAA